MRIPCKLLEDAAESKGSLSFEPEARRDTTVETSTGTYSGIRLVDASVTPLDSFPRRIWPTTGALKWIDREAISGQLSSWWCPGRFDQAIYTNWIESVSKRASPSPHNDQASVCLSLEASSSAINNCKQSMSHEASYASFSFCYFPYHKLFRDSLLR